MNCFPEVVKAQVSGSSAFDAYSNSLKIFLFESIYHLINFYFISLFTFSNFFLRGHSHSLKVRQWTSVLKTPPPGLPEHQLKHQSEETLKRQSLICIGSWFLKPRIIKIRRCPHPLYKWCRSDTHLPNELLPQSSRVQVL